MFLSLLNKLKKPAIIASVLTCGCASFLALAEFQYTEYTTTDNNCTYIITEGYDAQAHKYSEVATLTEFKLKNGNSFTLPKTVSYYSRWKGRTATAPVERYEDGVINNCDELVEINLFFNNLRSVNSPYVGCGNLLKSNPNLQTINLLDKYLPNEKTVHNFILDCPNLSAFKNGTYIYNAVDGALYNSSSSNKKLLIYPPAKTDESFDFSEVGSVAPGAFKGARFLNKFILNDDTNKDLSVYGSTSSGTGLFNKDRTKLIAVLSNNLGFYTIPASVTEIEKFATADPRLSHLFVAQGSVFHEEKSMIFDADNKLVAYPMNLRTPSLIIDAGGIDEHAFYFPVYLETLIDISGKDVAYARYLKESTALYLPDNLVSAARKLHANTHSFSGLLSDEKINTGSYKATINIPEGLKIVSTSFDQNPPSIYDDPEFHKFKIQNATISLKEKELSVTGLIPYQSYKLLITCQDESEKQIVFPVSFTSRGVNLELAGYTQTSYTVKADIGDTTFPITFENIPLKNGNNVITNQRPDYEYNIQACVNCYNTEFYASDPLKVKTASLNLGITLAETAGPTSLTLKAVWTQGTAEVSKPYFTINRINHELDETLTTTVTGFDPEKNISVHLYVTSCGKEYHVEEIFTTSSLILETADPKIVQSGKAIVCADSNIDDHESNAGFQWRKYEAPASMKSNEAFAPIWQGKMEGFINNLQPTSFYKVRAFYRSAAGNDYFGEWVDFDPSDFTWFEPTVHTYDATGITHNSVNVKGYAMQGSDIFQRQGFEYWISDNPIVKTMSYTSFNATAAPADTKVVLSSGQIMQATISGLQPDTEYTVRSFVTTDSGTYYGEEQVFRTKEFSGVDDVVIDGEVVPVKYYNINGVCSDSPFTGLNIILYSDGHTEKSLLR